MKTERIYQHELVSIEDLCIIVKRMELEISQLQKHIDLFGIEDDDYNSWMLDLAHKTNRLEFLQRRIRSRQAKIENQHSAAAVSLS